MHSAAAVVVAVLTSFVTARTFTVKNSCSFTIWPAVYTDPNVGHSKPDVPTGWEARPGSYRSFNVPNDWKSGRIWGRTHCDARGRCATGSCVGGIECDPNSGTGATPATLAEWTLDSSGDNDFYDVSLVDGFNLPMAVTNNVGCHVADCAADLLPSCPSQIRVTNNRGAVVGCKSSCGWDGTTVNSGSCCTGSHGTPETCPSSGVKFYTFFSTLPCSEERCRNSYVFAYDEASGTALWTCNSAKSADYTLTFCPSTGINRSYGPITSARQRTSFDRSATTSPNLSPSPSVGANAHSPSAKPESTPSSSGVVPSSSASFSTPPRVPPISTSTLAHSGLAPASPASPSSRQCKSKRRRRQSIIKAPPKHRPQLSYEG